MKEMTNTKVVLFGIEFEYDQAEAHEMEKAFKAYVKEHGVDEKKAVYELITGKRSTKAILDF